jgi:chorismate mutase/prephenate dehydratase
LTERRQQKRVAFLGPEGTFCEQAAHQYFATAHFTPYNTITDVFAAVEKNEVEYGVVPVENSTDGSVRETLDCFMQSKVRVCGEAEINVVHNLIVKPNTDMQQIQVVLSHPQALAQCRRYLETTLGPVKLRETSSTAQAVKLLNTVPNAAAIGTEAAAKQNQMSVVQRHIEDVANNVTRFFILGKHDVKPTDHDKTSIVFSTKHVPGALYQILEVFAIRSINLTKIESRPDRGQPWNYVFYLDFEGHRTEIKYKAALSEVRERCEYLKVLGSYPKAAVTPSAPPSKRG